MGPRELAFVFNIVVSSQWTNLISNCFIG